MTTTKTRRAKRSLAAIAAAMLMASVLAVVTGAPAQAANTSHEVLIDTNAGNVPDAREFAGQDRYDTALRLAKNSAQSKGGLGAVPTAFDVASALTTLGVDTVSRVDGDSAAAVSVALAQMANNGCADSLGLVANNTVALVRGNPDGVVAAPVLASSLANGFLVTPLIVNVTLSDNVGLAGTATLTDPEVTLVPGPGAAADESPGAGPAPPRCPQRPLPPISSPQSGHARTRSASLPYWTPPLVVAVSNNRSS